MEEKYSRVYAAIDLDAVVHNLQEMKKIMRSNSQIMAVIKADGYGHGALPIAKELENLPYVWGYGVATAEEGLILRRNKIEKPIVVLGATFPRQYRAMKEADIRPTVYSLAMAKAMSAGMEVAGKDMNIHIKVDTGMGRLGFPVTKQATVEIAQIAELPHIIVEGIFTHFATADEEDKAMSNQQMRDFHQMKVWLKGRGVEAKMYHCSNSAGLIDLPGANMDLVRAGIVLYGLWPSREVRRQRLDLKPVLSLHSRVVFLKELEPGKTISYGATFQTERTTRVATIPVGYGDGYPRSLSNIGHVLIRGQKAPILGRVCMDQFMVDVTDIDGVCVDDPVVLVGKSGQREITLDELGDLSGRFNYEFACDLGKRIPRVYYKDGKAVESRDCFDE